MSDKPSRGAMADVQAYLDLIDAKHYVPAYVEGLAALIDAAVQAEHEGCLAELDVWLGYYRDDCNDPDGQGVRALQQAIKAIRARKDKTE